MKKSHHSRQAGATLLEALAFLGIAAIIVVGAISMFKTAQGSSQANAMLQQITGMKSTIRVLYATQASYAGLSDAMLIAGKAVPDTLRITGGQIFSSFGGRVYVQHDGAMADGYSIVYGEVPSDVCIKVLSQSQKNWHHIDVDWTETIHPKSSVSDINTACTSFGKTVEITWYDRPGEW
jgi:Tfp pilus assembly protein PilW